MPGSFKDQCETFVNQYTDVIIDFLTHQLTPEQVCKQIGLCAQHETNAEQFDMIEHAREIIEQDEQLPVSTTSGTISQKPNPKFHFLAKILAKKMFLLLNNTVGFYCHGTQQKTFDTGFYIYLEKDFNNMKEIQIL